MGEEFNLQAFYRKGEEETPKQTRREGFIPVVLYGPSLDKSLSLKVRKGEFEKIYNQAGESSLINLQTEEEKPGKILIKDIQKNPIQGEVTHADFYQVKMDEKIYTEIPLRFVGEARTVKEEGGYLTKNLDSVEVECLPADLVHEIEVDISGLQTFDDDIKVGDIQVPKGIEISTDPEEVVVTTTPPKEEEEEEAEAEAEGEGEEAAEETPEQTEEETEQ